MNIQPTQPILITREDVQTWVEKANTNNSSREKCNPIIGNIFSRIWNLVCGNLTSIKVASGINDPNISYVYLKKDALQSLVNSNPELNIDSKSLVKRAAAQIALHGKSIEDVKAKLGITTPENQGKTINFNDKPGFTVQNVSVLRSVLASNNIEGMGELFHPASATRSEMLTYISRHMPEERDNENDFVQSLRKLIKQAKI